MCDLDEGDFSQHTDRKARVAHTCDGCREPISAGQRYRIHSGVGDGMWWTFKHCRRCTAMVEALHKVAHVRVVDLSLDCGEIWQSPPDDVAALAFALPRDFAETG